MYGGSTTSILLNTPGRVPIIITALEGNKMARNGQRRRRPFNRRHRFCSLPARSAPGITFSRPSSSIWR
jgi:hypothetical protein